MTVTQDVVRVASRSATRQSALDDRSAGADEPARGTPDARPARLDRLGWTVIVGGVLCAVGGLVVVLAWYANELSLLRAHANATPIVFNAGVTFVSVGVALVASVFGRHWLMLAGAAVAGLLGSISLLEHVLGRGLGIDQLLFRTSVAGSSDVAGRIAPNTAVCFLVVSAALVWRVRGPVRGRTVATATAAGVVLAIAGVAAAGYAVGEEAAYRWGQFKAMALPTTVLLILVGITLFALVLRDPQRQADGDDLRTRLDDAPHLRAQQWSVRRVVGVLSVLVYLPLGLLGYLSVAWTSQAVNREAEASVENAAALEAHAVGMQIASLRTFAASLASRPAIVAALTSSGSSAVDFPALQKLLDEATTLQPGVASVAIANPDGVLVALSPVTPGIIGHDFSFRDWYKGASRTGETYVSEAVQTAAAGHPFVVAIASPIRSGPGSPVVGYLSVGYLLTSIQEFASSFRVEQQVSLTVTDQRGVVVASPNQADGLVSVATDEPVRRALAGNSGVLTRNDRNGHQFIGYAAVGDIGWTVTASFSASEALDRIGQLRAAVAGITVILAAALTVALVLVARGWRARRVAER